MRLQKAKQKPPTAKPNIAIAKKEHFISHYDVFQYSEKNIFKISKKEFRFTPFIFLLVEGEILECNYRQKSTPKNQRRSKLFYNSQPRKATQKEVMLCKTA